MLVQQNLYDMNNVEERSGGGTAENSHFPPIKIFFFLAVLDILGI